MKKLLLSLVLAGATVSAFAQGQLNFSSAIAGAAFATNQTASTGGSGPSYPRASGAAFLAQLYVGDAGITDASLLATNSSAGPAPFLSGASAGLFAGGTRTFAGRGAGTITAQIRAWSSAFTSWEAAPETERTALSGPGAPNLIQVALVLPPTPVNSMVGIQTYVIGSSIPEPSSIALGLLGLGAVALFRRRK